MVPVLYVSVMPILDFSVSVPVIVSPVVPIFLSPVSVPGRLVPKIISVCQRGVPMRERGVPMMVERGVAMMM